ncbi:MAG: 7-cyano-7-deazaguanine synthase [Pyrinomonadaceae bacterium]|nr:7-cyano-7-deazaguanine synthase [Phycisphaerales bacterium]
MADAFRLNAISFYENGVTSINLAVCEQVTGARATRTTHPKTIRCFERFLSLLFERPFSVHTPFMDKTKTDVLLGIKQIKMADLCPKTMSCAHVISSTNLHTHCGICSQCIDRRLSELAANLTGDEISPSMYKVDPLTDHLAEEPSVILAESLIRLWNRLEKKADLTSLCTDYPELSRICRHLGVPPQQGGERILDLLRRNAAQMCAVLDRLAQDRIRELRQGDIPSHSLLGLAYRSKPTQALPTLDEAIEMEVGTRRVKIGNVEVAFTPRQEQLRSLLQVLVNREGHMVYFDMLCSEHGLWIEGKRADSTIRGAVSSLRNVLTSKGCGATAQAIVTGTHETKPYATFDRSSPKLKLKSH